MNRKGIILFFVGGLAVALFFLGRAVLVNRALDQLPWEQTGQTATGSPADKIRALAALRRSIDQLESLQKSLEQAPQTGIADSPQEDLTKDHARLEQLVSDAYPDMEEVQKAFGEVKSHWLAQVDRSLAGGDQPALDLPRLPAFQRSVYRAAAGEPIAEEYRELYSSVYRQITNLRDASYQEWELKTYGDFQDLLTLHSLRSLYLTTIVDNLGYEKLVELTPDRWKVMSLELRLVGFRYRTFLTVKKMTFQQYMRSGVAGWLEIFGQIGRLAAALFLPFGLFWALRAFSRWLVTSQGEKSRFSPSTRLFLGVLPELGTLLALVPMEQSLRSDLALMELAVVPGIARYVIYYRVGAQLTRATFLYVLRGLPQKAQGSIGDKIEKSVRILIGGLVGVNLFLYLVHFAIGKALIYWLFRSLSIWVTVGAFVIVSWIWKPLLPELAFSTLGTPFQRQVKVVEGSPFGWFLAPLILIGILALSLVFELASFGKRFDWFNELLATLFRHRVKASTVALQGAPTAYAELFREAGVNLESRSLQQAYEEMKLVLDDFTSSGCSSATLVLSGPRGSGRARVVDRLREEYCDTLEVAVLEFHTRILTEAEFVTSVAQQLLQTEVETIEELLIELEALSTRLVLVHGGHNLFLSQVGGFGAARVLARVASLSNLLFCFSFEPYSWRHLQGALPDVASHPVTIELKRLRPNEIRNTILERHRATGYELLYDSSLLGVGFDANDSMNHESAFFQLLWDTSEGVPGIAEEVWLDSLELVEENVVRARIPQQIGLSDLGVVNQDVLFLFAALYRHETLTAREAASVADLPFELTEQMFRAGVQRKFLISTPDGFRVNSLWYAPLARYLRRKNYLYGR